ncbi:endonuclease/exonuclease/phosphatase family protein [Paludisphaera soli]|uniref:endonuclease/exonuclease/phosphatase family protein n=1 Tax=Paludisphaera soli TaxID=2712865 RepID=UPI0013ED241D|nr:endonuclease/exonuclease/phosphatase family protein [Paludisphaera soli]
MTAAEQDSASSGETSAGPSSTGAMSRWTVRAIRAAGWGAAALASLGFAGAVAGAADLASHFRVAYALAMIPAIATYTVRPRRAWRRAAILGLVLLLDSAAIVVLYLPVRDALDPGSKQTPIRLLQFNTWPKNPRDHEVLALVRSERADVVSLQETSHSLREAVGRELSDLYDILSADSEMLLIRRDEPGIRMRDHDRHPLPGGLQAISAGLEIGGREVSVLSLHAMAPVGLARAAIRDAQFEWVARWRRAQPGPVIVLGDLNATPWSSPFGRLLREGGRIDSTRGFGVQPTWRTSYGPLSGPLAWPVQIPIDHCLHSAGFVTLDRKTGPACGSNHFPLLVTLGCTETAQPD